MYMDMTDGSEGPRRGDAVLSPRSLYWVLHSRKVHRKSLGACPRYQMRVMRSRDVTPELREKLLASAHRRAAGSRLFNLKWYPRTKKTFENYMKRGKQG
jgi:hypothetical protein